MLWMLVVLVPRTNNHDHQSNGFLMDTELAGKRTSDRESESNCFFQRVLSIPIILLGRPWPISLVLMALRRVLLRRL